MAKSKTLFYCTECGNESPRWVGQCSACGAWNTLAEAPVPSSKASSTRSSTWSGVNSDVQTLSDIEVEQIQRTVSGSAEFDRVLGGGLVPGSVVLIGGDPGIGKSTLLIQSLATIGLNAKVLYVTGEESPQQVAMNASRLGIDKDKLRVLSENRIESIQGICIKEAPSVMVVDSIQTVYSSELQSAPGSVSQVRECAAILVRLAKEQNITVILVGHVTKDGAIAGPRVLEHIVDTVLYFEGDNSSRYRLLRAMKNRFGAINEIGVFGMTDKGLRDVSNPSAMFTAREGDLSPGSVILATQEGTRPLLVELQALVDSSSLSNPRRIAVGVDSNRLAMLLAVLHRHAGLFLQDQDIFINVAGGVRVTETAADLAVMAAMISSFRDKKIPPNVALFGEIGLGGEIRPVQRGQERIGEAVKLGFDIILVPYGNRPKSPLNANVIAIKTINDFLQSLEKLLQS